MGSAERGSRVVLRHTAAGALDDVVVRGVELFRAEMLDSGHLWLSCTLSDSGGEGDRITFEVTARGKRLEFLVVEEPTGAVPMEE